MRKSHPSRPTSRRCRLSPTWFTSRFPRLMTPTAPTIMRKGGSASIMAPCLPRDVQHKREYSVVHGRCTLATRALFPYSLGSPHLFLTSFLFSLLICSITGHFVPFSMLDLPQMVCITLIAPQNTVSPRSAASSPLHLPTLGRRPKQVVEGW